MPALSWNEIRQNAIHFSREWKGAQDERAEAQTFWNEFLQVFGIRRRTVASFEEPVKSLKNTYHRIDLFWKGRLLAEHKSAGENLDKAESQAFQYIQELAASGREDEIPRYILLCNFVSIALYDLEPDTQLELPLWRGQRYDRIEFRLSNLHAHIKHFAFLIGQKTHTFGEQDEANLKAATIMADLHDAVAKGRYPPEALERLLVRLLFCLFADDTGIFEAGQFELYIQNRTREDASDLGPQLNALFDMLNTPSERRSLHLDDDLNAFPYVNGELFAEHLPTPGFNRDMRNRIVAACRFDWSRISPAIFGSLFQGIMDDKARRQIGAHYTSERDILKVIRGLFLDELRAEFDRIKSDRSTRRTDRLHSFLKKLAVLRFLDPACGCGNFLAIAYRELRRLELKVLKALYNDFAGDQPEAFTADEFAKLSQVDVNQFYGIEIGEWPARIAETALWLTDHQMNIELSLATGNLFQRIPLRAAPHIKCANALRFDWNELLPAKECSYVFGNPPFVGKKEQNAAQKGDHVLIWDRIKGAGILDYVTCWYVKAGEYIKHSNIRCAFVSTNSISQGEQVGVLWARLFNDFGLKIHFAHTTFAWQSEARGAAHVHVVIIGFAPFDTNAKTIFIYDDIRGEPKSVPAANINPYLADAPDIIIGNRTNPLCNVPPINYGSMMIDKDRKAGNDQGLIVDDEERQALIRECPGLKPYLRHLYGGEEYINATPRWCLWLVEAPTALLRGCERLRQRTEKVRKFRLSSGRKATNDLAASPHLFGEIRQPDCDYLLIPKVSSENRDYLPIGFLPSSVIASGSALVMPKASRFHFGVLASKMHMAWLRRVGGRMKSDYQYSSNIVYNSFPWPMDATPARRAKVEECAQRVLDVRQEHIGRGDTLADLYDPLATPAALVKAHQALDRAVDRCYRSKPFANERERVEYLFELYGQLTAPLAPTAPEKKARRAARPSTVRSAK
ncbi:MAG: class I SAM-dependent DNA methyltransferase [Candidatus Sumerlaeota bacterium]|nr:class I SAM-dependent DNA methyltransferase [Candidatus Sumerlaeota bacterium]